MIDVLDDEPVDVPKAGLAAYRRRLDRLQLLGFGLP